MRTLARALTTAESCLARKLRKILIYSAAFAQQSCNPAGSTIMGAFQSVPDDVLTGALTKCVLGHWPGAKKPVLRAVRTTCKDGRDFIQRIVADKNIFRSLSLFFWSTQDNSGTIATEPREMRVSARHVEAMGRVFGAGCTALYASGRSPERIAALEVFVSRTRRLESLKLDNAAVSVEVLLRMCRAVPRLEKLRCPRFMETSDDTIRAISEICPLLREAHFSRLGRDSGEYSPVETWARLFPQLQAFSLHGGRWVGYEPTRIDAIHACALGSQAQSLDLDACHITAEVMEAIVGTPLGDRIEMLGFSDDFEQQDPTDISPAAFLATARGFPKLTDIHIPKGSTMGGPGFYVDLSRATTILTTLEISDDDATDACVAAACRHLRLTHLALRGCGDLTSSVVESITGGQAAGTLTILVIKHCAELAPNSLRAVDVLRLVTGCPKINCFSWHCHRELHEYAELDEGPCKAIVELLAGRVEDRDERVDCYAGDWNELRIEPGDDIGSDEEDCIFE